MAGWQDVVTEWASGDGRVSKTWAAGNLIGGTFRQSVSGRTLPVLAPATNEDIGTIPRSTAADVQDAVDAAAKALPAWRATPPEQRSKLMYAIADRLEQRLWELARLESLDQGKPVSLAGEMDIPRSIANFRYFAGAVLHTVDGAYTMPDAINYTQYTPIGIAGLITPWNLPLYLLTWKVAPALAAGNCIVAKPSEMTPFTATALAEILAEVLPAGVFNLVHGLGGECGQAIVEHPLIKAVSFTGGTVTGRRVAATAAPMFKKLSLELGGKNATVVFADCDWGAAVETAVRAGFSNQGEICLCGSRLLVERSIHDKFVAAMVAQLRALFRPGDPRSSSMGALVSREHLQKVKSYITLARDLGGKIECGGEAPKLHAPWNRGNFLQPTIITGLAIDSRPAVEEIFGPVVTVHPFDTVQDAIRMANATQYGLAGSVWTTNLNKGHAVAQGIESGMIWVNCWLQRDLRVHFGGVKNSGVGREGGRLSLDFFSESKNICVKINSKL
ncbi:2-aminomuconic 6-semialdehyde dehydrogenase [Diplonema papillatum]|nr:2-aminomuconic 6-semialdehyde dehydrogenase [Diplonema papillatum]